MRKLLVIPLALIALQFLAVMVGPRSGMELRGSMEREWIVYDDAFNAGENSAPCNFDNADTVAAPAYTNKCYVPYGRTLVLRELGVTLAAPLTAAQNEDCKIVLETSTGQIAASAIEVGESNTACGITLNATGETCRTSGFESDSDATVAAGTWWAVSFDTATAGTCAQSRGVNLWVKGDWY